MSLPRRLPLVLLAVVALVLATVIVGRVASGSGGDSLENDPIVVSTTGAPVPPTLTAPTPPVPTVPTATTDPVQPPAVVDDDDDDDGFSRVTPELRDVDDDDDDD